MPPSFVHHKQADSEDSPVLPLALLNDELDRPGVILPVSACEKAGNILFITLLLFTADIDDLLSFSSNLLVGNIKLYCKC
jgi:hypothetical protein